MLGVHSSLCFPISVSQIVLFQNSPANLLHILKSKQARSALQTCVASDTLIHVKEVAEVLNKMRDDGVIKQYALFGAAAQMRYTEPLATLDADVLVSLPSAETIDILAPIYAFCKKHGYSPQGEAIQIGAWPVQFIPTFSALTEEALRNAETADFEGVPFRVVRADYLAVIALSVGRAKDFSRILGLLESGSTSTGQIESLAHKHGLSEEWSTFTTRFLDG